MNEEPVVKSEAEWRQELGPERYRVLREKGTEPPGSGAYYHSQETGMYLCGACGAELFSSTAKYDSGSGWPSFFEPVATDQIATADDHSLGMKRTEIMCRRCGSHLGHVFDDGPEPTGKRYCVNSLSLMLKKKNPSGFSLVEILVVIAIIGLLSTMAMLSLNSARTAARDAKRLDDISNIRTALGLYYADKQTYPAGSGLALGGSGAESLCDNGLADTCSGTVYLQTMPAAPTPADGSCSDAQNDFVYTQTGSGAGYTITFCLGRGVSDLGAGPRTASTDGVQ